MKTYKFDVPKKWDVLENGKIRCYYNMAEEELVIESKPEIMEDDGDDDWNDEEPKGIEKEETKTTTTMTLYTYSAVDIDGPIDKGKIVDAIIRAKYSQSEVEAIIRKKIARAEGSSKEFTEFNNYAEYAKTEANWILSED